MGKTIVTEYEDYKLVSNIFDPSDSLYVCEFGRHAPSPGYSYGPAVRTYYLIHFIEKGKGYIERKGEKTFLKEGDAFLITPDEVTFYKADEKEPWQYCWICFNGPFAKKALCYSSDKLFFKFRKSGLIALKTAIENDLSGDIELLDLLTQALASIKEERESPKEEEMISAVKYIETNYFHDLDVSAVAKEFGYTRAYFTTKFTQKTGRSPYAYLNSVRFERAKKLLKQTSLSVEEIAFSVGFSSLSRFSSQFKKEFGVSPSAYKLL